MRPSRIIYAQKPLPIPTFFFLAFAGHEVYRIGSGTHPILSPYLDKKGIVKSHLHSRGDGTNDEGFDKRAEKVENGWVLLNGVPIPKLEMLIRPFRRD